MATVDGKTSIKIDDLVNGTVTSGYVTPDGQLILVTRGGEEMFAGNVGSQQPVGDQWVPTLEYVPGDVVSYAGALWKAVFTTINEPPSLYTRSWSRLTGEVTAVWSEHDPYFNGDDIDAAWDYSVKTGSPVVSFTSVPGEFESGTQALKITLGVSEVQRLFSKEENIVQGGDVITVVIRAKLLSSVPSATLDAKLTQNLDFVPSPGNTDSVDRPSDIGGQSVSTSWETYSFEITTTEDLPRATISIIAATTAASGAVFLFDYIRVFRETVGGGGGGGGTSYFFEQTFVLATNPWVHVHGLGTKGVSVYTEDASGDEMNGDVSYPDNNTVQVDWAYDMTGTFRVFI